MGLGLIDILGMVAENSGLSSTQVFQFCFVGQFQLRNSFNSYFHINCNLIFALYFLARMQRAPPGQNNMRNAECFSLVNYEFNFFHVSGWFKSGLAAKSLV